MRYIFVHGWGFGSSFWKVLDSFFPDTEKVDFGFLGEPEHIPAPAAEPTVYITHSLGTVWALRHRASHMKALVAVNGFAGFSRFADARVLSAMQKRLKRDAPAQMAEFWAMCGVAPDTEVLNVEKLREGLSWLAEWDARAALDALGVPVLALAGEQDKVTPLAAMKEEWAGFNLKICAGGGHVLPMTHAEWCAAQIKGFTDGF